MRKHSWLKGACAALALVAARTIGIESATRAPVQNPRTEQEKKRPRELKTCPGHLYLWVAGSE